MAVYLVLIFVTDVSLDGTDLSATNANVTRDACMGHAINLGSACAKKAGVDFSVIKI